METKFIRGLVVLGIPGVALGILYLLLKTFNFQFSQISQDWTAAIAILFLLIVGSITFYALHRWSPEHKQQLQKSETTADISEGRELSFPPPKNEERHMGEVPFDFDIGDVAYRISNKMAALPLSPSEKDLFPFIEQLFRRPAFYVHPERNYGYGLYAVVATRLIWEQQVIPRLRKVRREPAAVVLRRLLSLEDFMANACGTTPEQLTSLTDPHIHIKSSFLHQLNQQTPIM